MIMPKSGRGNDRNFPNDSPGDSGNKKLSIKVCRYVIINVLQSNLKVFK